MTKEEAIEKALQDILRINNNSILCELPTGYGKSRISLELLKHRFKREEGLKVLIVVPKLILIQGWKEEFKKWHFEDWLNYVTFVTYKSFPKIYGHWNYIIFDEGHHLSERCRDAMKHIESNSIMILSATVKKDLKMCLRLLFKDLYCYKIEAKEAMENTVLPTPRVILIPMSLDNTEIKCSIIRNPKQEEVLEVPYKDRWKYTKVKNKKIIIPCTQHQWYDNITSLIEWAKDISKPSYLRYSGQRLKWLSEQKTSFVKEILNHLENERVLTFCSGAEQSEMLGKYCITYKDKKKANANLEAFNSGKINHITSCEILTEGANLTNCKIALYACLNSSDRLIVQKMGRALRHKSPILIIPYYKGTRDAEIVNQMLTGYNLNQVSLITDLNNLNKL